jgi:hypothetical protein
VKLLLDSVILIDHFNGIAEAARYLADCRDAAISVITRAEVLAGFEPLAARKAVRLFHAFPNVPIDPAAADLAAALRRRHGWKLPDAFQAAIARQYGLRLATRNTKDFPPKRFAFVVVPYVV